MNNKFMKFTSALLALIMVLTVLLTSCKDNSKSDIQSSEGTSEITGTKETESESESETEAEEPFKEINNLYDKSNNYHGYIRYISKVSKYVKAKYEYNRTTDNISVNAGDKIYFGPCDPNFDKASDTVINYEVMQKGHIHCYDGGLKAIEVNIPNKKLEVVDRFPNGNVIYCYTVPEGGKNVSFTIRSCYEDIFVVSKEPFKARDFENHVGAENMQNLNVKLNSKGVITYKSDAFKGKKTLFIGDSICAAGRDTESLRGWAGRIADATGMTCYNYGAGGYSVSVMKDRGRIINKYNEAYSAKGQFDFVIMHGGVNDVWDKAKIGTVSDSFDPKDFDTHTFAGALEELFCRVINTQKNAKLGYIINFPTLKHFAFTNNKNVSKYVDVAKQACEKWNIPYLNLFEDEEFCKELNVNTDEFLFDKLHPSNYGYDIIYKYVMLWMDKIPAYNDIKANPDSFNLQAFPLKEEYKPAK